MRAIYRSGACGGIARGRYFFEPEPHASDERNALRTGRDRVPPAAVFGTLKRLERPRLAEGFDEMFRLRLPDLL